MIVVSVAARDIVYYGGKTLHFGALGALVARREGTPQTESRVSLAPAAAAASEWQWSTSIDDLEATRTHKETEPISMHHCRGLIQELCVRCIQNGILRGQCKQWSGVSSQRSTHAPSLAY